MSAKSEPLGAGERVYLHIYDYETKEFSGLTTYHGLVRIYNSNTWPSRIFWCVVVLSCLSLFMIHSGYLLLGYHSKPTLFQVNTVVAEAGIYFPDITICNYNPVYLSRLERYNMSSKVFSYLLTSYNDHFDDDGNSEEHALFERYLTDSLATNFSIADFFEKIRPTCEDMVLSCSFAGEIIENCCSFSNVVPTDLGYCVRFQNSELNKTQYLSGSSYGWQFILDGNNAEHSDSYLTSEMGFRVLVHEIGKEHTLKAHGLSVPPGVTLHAGISVKNISLLQRKEWGYCQSDWDAEIHGIPLSGHAYTATHCEWNCLAREWLSTCGCLPMKLFNLNVTSDSTICTPLDIRTCADTVYANSTSCNCDVECQIIEYEMRMSYSDIITSSISRRFALSDEHVRNNISVVNLFLQSMTYERHEQQKQLQTADLLSNIAGSMGLFLGMSTVTLLEIFIYLFKSVWGTVNTERQKQFMEAMLEEENERRQSLVIVEEQPPEQHTTNKEEHAEDTGSTPKRPSKRVSLAPLHIHMDRRRSSSALPLIDHNGRTHLAASRHNILSPRKSLVSNRRASTMETTIGSLLPSFHHPRKSIAAGALYRRGSVVEGAGEILPTRRGSIAVAPHSHRRPSTVVLAGPSGQLLNIQQSDDAIHLALNNRRRSSVHPKHFLL